MIAAIIILVLAAAAARTASAALELREPVMVMQALTAPQPTQPAKKEPNFSTTLHEYLSEIQYVRDLARIHVNESIKKGHEIEHLKAEITRLRALVPQVPKPTQATSFRQYTRADGTVAGEPDDLFSSATWFHVTGNQR